MDGQAIGILGAALCMILCGAGSAYGLYKTGTAASGVIAEDVNKFSKVLILSVLPATQGIYGFVIAILKGNAALALGAGADPALGWAIFASALALGLTGMVSAIFQGRTAQASIYAVAKDAKVGKVLLFPAMVETYAILALVISIMM